MASVSSILSLLVFTSCILSKAQTRAENIVSGVHHRQRRQADCDEAEFNATYPCTLKEFTEVSTKNTCVMFSEWQRTLRDANITCQEIGSNLVRINDKELNAALVEKGSSKKWWVGLRWKDGRFMWQGDSAQVSFSRWKQGSTPMLSPGTSSSCVYLNAGQYGLWSTAPCSDTLFFICQRDSVRSKTRAVLEVSGAQNDAERSTTVEMGKDLQATCEVYGNVVDNVVFELENQDVDSVKMYDRSNKEVNFSPEARYERWSDVCWQVTTVTLTLSVTIAMDNGTLYCRAILHDGLTAESPKRRINVKVPPGRPTLTIEFDEKPNVIYAGRDRIVATCVAPIGVSGSSLTWAIINKSRRWSWSRKLPSRHKWLPVSWFEALSPRGRVMNSTLVIYSEFSFSLLIISCLSYSKAGNIISDGQLFSSHRPNPLRAIVAPIHMKTFDPLPPRLALLFVSQQGETGVKTKVQCIAFVGRVKALTWSLNFNDGDIRKVVVGESGKIITGVLREGVAIGETKVRRLKKGPEILSTLSIESPKDVDKTAFVCFSHKNSDEKVDKLRRSVIFHSKVPLMTEFSVSYHKPPSTVYGNRTMKATCTASLGKNGNLTWALRTRRGEALWTVSADGKLNSGGATGVDVSARKVGPGAQKDQSLLTSNLSLVVNESLHDGNVTCRTRPGEGPIEVWNVSRKLVVEYLPRPPILVVRDVAPSVTWIEQANCSAYVGSRGVIRWLMLFKDGSVSWQFDMMGSLTGVVPNGVNESEHAVAFHPRHGPRINSSLEIDVREFPEKTKLVCCSDNFYELGLRSELVVWSYINSETHKLASKRQFRSIDDISWILIGFLLLLLPVFLVNLYFYLREKRLKKLKELPEGSGDVSAGKDRHIVWDASGLELSNSQADDTPHATRSYASNEYSFWSSSGFSSNVDRVN